MTEHRPILVTGAHRSGSTFVGKILSAPLGIGYVEEPFNLEWGVRGVEEWFPYVKKDGLLEPQYRQIVTDVLAFDAKYKNPWWRSGNLPRSLANLILGGGNQLSYRWRRLNPLVNRLLIKDPIACLSSEWLHREHGMDVLVLVRHPAAFVASLRRLNWRFRPAELFKRKELYEDHLRPIADEHPEIDIGNDVEQWAVLWKSLYTVMTTYVDRNPRMLVKTHEEISGQPVAQFREIFDRFGLNYSTRVHRIVREMTGSRNPVDPAENKTHSMYRDSKKNIKRWKKLLGPGEVEIIKDITYPLWKRYYSDGDW